MKKNLLSIICFLTGIFSVQAQNLYGLTSEGGSNGGGALIKFNPTSNTLAVAKSFEAYAGHPYYTNFVQASNGKLYGMTAEGGNNSFGVGDGYGVIFSVDPSSSAYTLLKAFDNINGRNPQGSLVQADNGKLYGMTIGGGSNDYGVIFSFDPSSSTYVKLFDFDGNNGRAPRGSLVKASNGKLYGMTSEGGSNGVGVIFSFDPSSSAYTKLKDLDVTTGGTPFGSLVQSSNGKLYGMTINGGINSAGVIFSFDPSSSAYTKLKDFGNTDGSYPKGSLVQVSNGRLYGMTGGGGINDAGVIFSFDPSTSGYTKLKDFDGTNGGGPAGSLMQASNGKLYGMTGDGGSNGDGVIFSFDHLTSAYVKLIEFDRIKGNSPSGSLMQASNGKLYGMTYSGGGYAQEYSSDGNGRGVIFSFDLSSSTYTKLMNLDANNGGRPSGALLKADNGKLYGMTSRGGSFAVGVIFSFEPSTSTYAKLMDFDGTNGAHPFGSLIKASDGKLYGMTNQGGSNNWGVLFSFDPSTSTYTKLKDFYGTNVIHPSGSLVQASDGKLYGMGGNGSRIFSYVPSSSTFTELPYVEVAGPHAYGSLMQASNNKLYGMNAEAGPSGGILFSLDPLTSTFVKLKDFNPAEGHNPIGSLIQASNGKLYGMTSSGGTGFHGVVFSFDPSSSTYSKLKDFDGINGSGPGGNLMQASNGKLYGMAGGGSSAGVIFSFDPSTSTYTKLKDFDGSNGANPNLGAAFIEVTGLPTGVTNITNSFHEVKIFPNPVSGSAIISIFLERPENISVKIFDANGRIIKVLADARLKKGRHDLKWNFAEISAGTYFVQFDAGAYSDTKQFSVIK